MSRIKPASVHFVVLAIAVGLAVQCHAYTLCKGVRGGTVRGSITDINHKTVECSIEIPDSFTVLDVQFESNRVLIAASVERARPGRDASILSEFWMFSAPDTILTPVTFRDRKALLSHKSSYGESYTVYAGSVNCDAATAVRVHGWEWASTQIFDDSGVNIPLDQSLVASVCGCRPDYIRPVAWVSVGREWNLICVLGEEGGRGPFNLIYHLSTGTVDTLTSSDLGGELGRLMIEACAGR
jgi:hypothetical protein